MIFIDHFNACTNQFILENVKRTELLDKAFLEKLKVILVQELNVQDFIKRIVPTTLSSDIAIYDFSQKTVFVDINQVIFDLLRLMEKGYLRRISDESTSFKFFQAIIHEFLHAYQDLLCLSFRDMQVFLEILRDSILIHDGYNLSSFKAPSVAARINGDRIYKKYHDLFPGERHADLTSYDILILIFESIPSLKGEDVDGFKEIFYELSSKYYRFGNKNSYPIERFYKMANSLERLKLYDFSSYSVHERFIGGMPLSKKELNKEKSLILRS